MSHDRSDIYFLLYDEIYRYHLTEEGRVLEAAKLDLFKTMSALTDAVRYEKLSLTEARHLLRKEIAALLAPPSPPKSEAEVATETPDTGVVKF
jgi:predicted HTH domain antitoxin